MWYPHGTGQKSYTALKETIGQLGMDTFERFRRAVRHPRLFARGLNRVIHNKRRELLGAPKSLDIFDEDWDTLVILDACRYDMFEAVNHIDGLLTARTSKASATTQWLQANIAGRDLRDTVYVTANPQYERNRESLDANFHRVINVWLDHGWDHETGTVRAETVTAAAIDAHKQHPNKRVIVHYMQPHYPFVDSETRFDKRHLSTINGADDDADGENVWNKKFLGQIDASCDELWSMYLENLEYVLEHVEDLISGISGKIIITSDHGNYVGERASPIPIREYGHPRGLYDEEVVQVPWLESEQGERRETHAGGAEVVQTNVDKDIVSERLRDLGYRNG